MKLTFPALVAAALTVAAPAMADLVVPNMSYRTGPYAANGIPFADGYRRLLHAAERTRRRHRRAEGPAFPNARPPITPKKGSSAMRR